jgi:hypothetical protein
MLSGLKLARCQRDRRRQQINTLLHAVATSNKLWVRLQVAAQLECRLEQSIRRVRRDVIGYNGAVCSVSSLINRSCANYVTPQKKKRDHRSAFFSSEVSLKDVACKYRRMHGSRGLQGKLRPQGP